MMNDKINLFLQNNDVLKNIKGIYGFDLFKKTSALTLTMKNKKADVERITLAKQLIKDNSSVFSNFRGNNLLSTAITMSLEEDMEGCLKELIEINEKLKEKFSNNMYLPIVATIIYGARDRIAIDDAIRNTRLAYDYMKKNHRFLTGQEDIAAAAILAVTSSDFEETFKEIEECFSNLKNRGIGASNSIQSLSHIMSLIEYPSQEKCEKVINMRDSLKHNKVNINYNAIPILGIVAFLTEDANGFAKEVNSVSEELRKEKGFGNFTLGKSIRDLLAISLVALEYVDRLDNNIKDAFLDTTKNISLTIAIAIQAAITASVVASTAAASSASN